MMVFFRHTVASDKSLKLMANTCSSRRMDIKAITQALKMAGDTDKALNLKVY